MGLRPMMSRPRLFWSRPARMCQTCRTSCPSPDPDLVPKRVIHRRTSCPNPGPNLVLKRVVH
eukprot:scaffold13289_cov59-Phaeocystis_antarctica.AAC.1